MSPKSNLRPILLAEDNPNDVELTLSALHSLNLANEIVVVHDGARGPRLAAAPCAPTPAAPRPSLPPWCST